MAELVNLHQADKHLARCRDDMADLRKMFDGSDRKAWSEEQLRAMGVMLGVLLNLSMCVGEIMHNNRDGRGTPKK